MAEMVGTVAPGRRGSSPSANDADHAQRKTADKQGLKRTGDGDDKEEREGRRKAEQGIGREPRLEACATERGRPVEDEGGWRVIRTLPARLPASQVRPKDWEGPCGPSSSRSPAAVKGGAKAASAKGATPASAKGPPGADTLREMLHRMEAHSRDVQQHPVVDAGLAGTARRSVTPQSDASGCSTCDSAGTRQKRDDDVGKTRPHPHQVQLWSMLAAERGVSAALATGGRPDKHAALAAFLAHFDAAEHPEHAPALAIMDTAHVGPLATHGGGSAEPTAATGAVRRE
ncbi:unnamed protein product [Closterium sp. NIES-65]|nr:unnamed protein product [Closterium sp. NIES-65]